MTAAAQTVTVRVPLTIRRQGGRKIVIRPDGNVVSAAAASRTRADPTLVKALARAHRWKRLLESGRYASISEMAAAEKIDRGYLGRILLLTLLAPDIVEAIPDGTQPSTRSATAAVVQKSIPPAALVSQHKDTSRAMPGSGRASRRPPIPVCLRTIDVISIEGRFPVICIDPPWRFTCFSSKGEGRSATAHYDCMAFGDLCKLPVRDHQHQIACCSSGQPIPCSATR